MSGVAPIWIDERDVLILHDKLLAAHGGAEGVRDLGGLQSGLARAKQIAAYSEKADKITLAAAYTVGVVRNHLFEDGNKRTGFVIGVLFLELNGFRFTASESAAADAVIALAAGKLEEAGYVQFLRENVSQQS